MIWRDTIADIMTAINAQSFYNTSRSTTPDTLGLNVYNQAQDWLCMYKPWRDLTVDAELSLDSDKAVTLPEDFGMCMHVYTDSSSIGKPTQYFYLNDPDTSKRYIEQVTIDSETGVRTIKFVFPSSASVPSNLHVVYSKVLSKVTQNEVDEGTKLSFFPINIMLIVAKKVLQDYYGISANQDPGWINLRVNEEIKMLEGYAYENNVALDISVHDSYGNPIFISGSRLDGSSSNVYSPYLPSTYFTGGT